MLLRAEIDQVRASSQERLRQLNQKLVKETGIIQSFIRIAPCTSSTFDIRVSSEQEMTVVRNEQGVSQRKVEDHYMYDKIFKSDCSQRKIFGEIEHLIRSAVTEGTTAAIVAYGKKKHNQSNCVEICVTGAIIIGIIIILFNIFKMLKSY